MAGRVEGGSPVLISRLDPHSTVMDELFFRDMVRQLSNGTIDAIGIEFLRASNRVEIVGTLGTGQRFEEVLAGLFLKKHDRLVTLEDGKQIPHKDRPALYEMLKKMSGGVVEDPVDLKRLRSLTLRA